jgi:hypothetical protein
MRGKLETAVRRVGSWCEMATSLGVGQLEKELVVRQSPASTDINMRAEEATASEAVTRRQPMKISGLRRLNVCCREL